MPEVGDKADSLYVELGLDMDELAKGIQKAAGLEEELEEETQQLHRQLEALDGQAVEIDGSFDTSAIRAKMEALESDTITLDVEADTSGVSSSGRTRLPGELDEIAQGARFIGQLGTTAQASLASVTALTAVLAGAGGLSAAALVAANKTGVLNDRIAGLKARGKSTAREFAQTFAPVLKQDVFPALRNLLRLIRQSDDELASFTSGVFDFFNTVRKAREGKKGGIFGKAAGVAASQAGPLLIPRVLSDLTGDSLPVPERGPLGFLASLTKPNEKTKGAAARIKNKIRSVNNALKEARKRFSAEKLFGVGKKSTLRDRVNILEKLRDKLIKTRAAVDLGKAPQQWFRLDQRIQDLQSSLQKAKSSLKDLQATPPKAPDLPTVTPKNKILSPKATSFEPFARLAPTIAAANRLQGTLSRISQMPFLPQAAKGRRRVLATTRAVRRLQRQGRLLSKTALKGFLRDLGLAPKMIQKVINRLKKARSQAFGLRRTIKRIGANALAEGFRQVGRAIGGAKNALEQMQKTAAQVLSQLGRMLLIRGIMSGNIAMAAAGAGLSIGGGLIQSLDSGGVVMQDTLAQVHAGEAVVPLDRLNSMLQMPSKRKMEVRVTGQITGSMEELRVNLDQNAALLGR